MKLIDHESEDIIQRTTTFAHAFSDIKSLQFKDETIEEALVTGFLGSLPEAKAPEIPAQAAKTHAGWVIGIKDKPHGIARAFGMKVYESYHQASKELEAQFSPGNFLGGRRPSLAPYDQKADYEIVPIYR